MASASMSPFANAVAGAGGAVVALTVVYPLDVVKTRLQVQSRAVDALGSLDKKPYQSTLHELLSTLRYEGLAGLYAGLPAGLIGQASTNFAYFYFYSALRGAYTAHRPARKAVSTGMELLISAGAGALAQIFTIPASVVVTRQQTMPPKERRGFAETWNQIVCEDGYRGLWRGLKPSLVLVSNPAITYGFFEKLRNVIIAQKQAAGVLNPEVSALQTFLLGVLSKSIATIVCYPYIYAKVKLQYKAPRSVRGSAGYRKYKDALDVLSQTLREEGIYGWFKGLHPQLLKAALSQAILFVSKDKLAKYTLLLFALVRRQAMATRLVKA